MFDKLEALEARYRELEIMISDPDLPKDRKRYKEVLQEHAHLSNIIQVYEEYKKMRKRLEETEALLEQEKDPELRILAKEEMDQIRLRLSEQEKELKELLVPRDPRDDKNVIMEIRAGTGGEEAALFAADLFRMYTRYAEAKGWKVELMEANETELGGFKEIIFSVSGPGAYGDLRYESGVHRVQRVPVTEAGGRIHTSAVTVAVLPEAEETEVEIRPEDLRIDVFRASGAGGQHVNKTESAVRITHLPTGIVVTCQDEKSQHKNKARALRVLRARLYEMEEQKRLQEESAIRRSMVGSGDRSERIRTYNFPQNRVTDHRINLTLYKLDSVLEGDLGEIIEGLKLSEREEAYKTQLQ
ncbi:MAG: peptide chain release factor 1 [Spirochaetes bacterium]|nr:peptide chain release factor 1 [Spirochaetota bacterium]